MNEYILHAVDICSPNPNRELTEYKDMKDMTPSHVTYCQILYARRHDRDVCLKRYHLPNEESRTIFLRSCRSWSALNHVGLMRLRAVFFDGDYGYTETIRPGGGSIRDWLSRSSRPLDIKYLVIRRLCETVGYLHSHQISHHDITLETIGISEASSPMLFEPNMAALNDGGASLITGGERWWLTRVGVGNQFQGLDMRLRNDTRFREDVYQLGIVIYRVYGSVGGNLMDLNIKTFKQLGSWPPLPMAPESANQLIDGMLKAEPAARLMLATSLKLDFFKRPPAIESDSKSSPPSMLSSFPFIRELM
jgi:serine/threonine protein kinase